MIGKALGEYRIIKELGKGGMGVVYLAEHMKLKQKYALKVLPEELSQNQAFIERFHIEARVMAQLKHPNIVQVHFMGQDEGVHYLIMEYLESETGRPKTLAHLLNEKGGRLAQAEAKWIVQQVLDALDYAHNFKSEGAPGGIIHRDIKPGNILIDKDGSIKVSDFGLAKIVGNNFIISKIKQSLSSEIASGEAPPDVSQGAIPTERAEYHVTSTGAILGTYDYMSPEQKEGKPVDARSDIYACGVMLYRMLTGDKPEGRFKLPSGVDPRLSRKWDKVMDKCLQRQPDDRFSSASEVAAAIEPIGRSVVKSPQTDGTFPGVSRLDAETVTAPVRRPAKKRFLIGCGVTAFMILLAAASLIIWLFSGPEGGVKTADNMDEYALQYIEKHRLLNDTETLVVYYDATISLNGSDAAILTTECIMRHKDGNTTSVDLKEIDDVQYRYESLTGDIIEVKDRSGTRLRIEIAPLNQGESFYNALMDAWKGSGAEK